MLVLVLQLTGVLAGFGLSNFLWGRSEGKKGRLPNLRIRRDNKTLYIHHWLVLSIILSGVLFAQFKYHFLSENIFSILTGLLIGGIVQGLKYKDWNILIK